MENTKTDGKRNFSAKQVITTQIITITQEEKEVSFELGEIAQTEKGELVRIVDYIPNSGFLVYKAYQHTSYSNMERTDGESFASNHGNYYNVYFVRTLFKRETEDEYNKRNTGDYPFDYSFDRKKPQTDCISYGDHRYSNLRRTKKLALNTKVIIADGTK